MHRPCYQRDRPMFRESKQGVPDWNGSCFSLLRSPGWYSTLALRDPISRRDETMKKSQKGFSLIELLIVVAIILIIAAIAIPNLLRARIAANESSAVGSVRSVVTAEVTYSSTWGTGFAVALGNLGGVAVPCAASAATACLLDPVLSAGNKSGYNILAPGGAAVGGSVQPFVV